MKLILALTLLLAGTARADEPKVTLDVKDEDVRVILKAMQKQCGIQNLLVDKEVSGAGMLYFRDVPCTTAFRVIEKQFGLKARFEQNVVTLERRPN